MSYQIEYETYDRNYLNPGVNVWSDKTYLNQPKVTEEKRAIVSYQGGKLKQVMIEDGRFEYDLSIQ